MPTGARWGAQLFRSSNRTGEPLPADSLLLETDPHLGADEMPLVGVRLRILSHEMSPIKLTNAPEGFEYYKVCDPKGICRVVRGLEEAQRIMKETPGLTATKMP